MPQGSAERQVRELIGRSQSWGLSSVYDFNFDGLTDAADRTVIEQNLGLDCRS